MKVLIKAPNNGAIEADIPNTLKALQGWVNGYIEVVKFEPEWGVICNENGYTKGFPKNIWVEGTVFFGTIIFVGFGKNEDGEDDFADCPLTKAELLEVIGE